MAYGELWAKNDLSKKLIGEYFDRFGHLLKWKEGYKETILEVGCADGSITRDVLYGRYRAHIGKLMAVDKLDGMIEYAKSQNAIEEIDFVTMDITEADVEAMRGRFDRIFTFNTLHWIPDNRALMIKFFEMLTPGGKVFIGLIADTPIHQSYKRLQKEGPWLKYVPLDPVLEEYTEDPVRNVTEFMTDAGFKVELCESKKDTYVVEEFGDLITGTLAMYKYIDRIPQELREEFLQYHVKYSYDNSVYMGEPNIYAMPCDSLICIGSKNQ